MKQTSLLILGIGACALFFAGLFILALAYVSKSLPDYSQLESQDTVAITQAKPFVQGIPIKENNLSTLYIHLHNPNYANQDAFIVRLYDGNGMEVRALTISGNNIGPNDWVKLQFAPIIDSAGKTYVLNLSSDTIDGNLVNVYTSKAGDVAIRATTYQPPSIAIPQIMQSVGTRLSRDTLFILLYAVIITAVAACAVFQFIRERRV